MKITVLATRSHLQELLRKLTEHPDPIFKQARLGELLRVELKPERPEDFLVERLSPAEQAVLDDEATIWEWIVTARRPGDRQTLRVLVSNLVGVAGRLIEKGLPSQTITLDVTLTVIGPCQPFDGPALHCFSCYAPADHRYREELEKPTYGIAQTNSGSSFRLRSRRLNPPTYSFSVDHDPGAGWITVWAALKNVVPMLLWSTRRHRYPFEIV